MINKSSVEIRTKWDIVAARQFGRDKAREVGFGTVDQARISTAISELARNVFLYGAVGEIIIERAKNEEQLGVCITALYNGQAVKKRTHLLEEGGATIEKLEIDVERMKRLMDDIEIQEDAAGEPYIKVRKWLD